mmetsp:Transcript_2768/g.4041  ORF Transcript_2768/g.4041 Transcript_2768/m.4041 type:complete len:114 (-) Transcript_2768:4938-5279(-)
MASNNNRNNADDKMDEDDGMIPLELNDEEDDILEIQGLLGDSDRDGSWISSSRSPQFATRKTRRRTTASALFGIFTLSFLPENAQSNDLPYHVYIDIVFGILFFSRNKNQSHD